MDTRKLIEKLHAYPIKSNEAREFLAGLYQKRREKYIPYWYQLHMKALCKLFEFDEMDNVEIPNEIDGVFVYYALDTKEMHDIAGNEAFRDYSYKNMWWSPDDQFIRSAIRNYSRCHEGYVPQFAVMHEDTLVFVTKDRFEKAMRESEEKKNRENLVVDKQSE